MPSTIKMRRGARNLLPILSAGEFGFATDSKELFIGDGVANSRIGPAPPGLNMLHNGNFQVSQNIAESNTVINPSGAQYLFGLYFIENPGTVAYTVRCPIYGAGKLRFGAASANMFPSIKYRITTPKLTQIAIGSPSTWMANVPATLSFDYSNNSAGPISFTYGQNAVAGVLPANSSGRFVSSGLVLYDTMNTTPGYFEVVIFRPTGASAMTAFEIGNIKLETGTVATPFVPYSTVMDEGAIRSQVQYTDFSARATVVTANTIEVHHPVGFNQTYMTPRRLIIDATNTKIMTLAGVEVTGFSWISDTTGPCPRFVATKTAHGLADATVRAAFTLDYRA